MASNELFSKTNDSEKPRKQIDDPHDDCSHWCGKI